MNGFPSILESIEDLNKSQIDALLERARALKNRAPARLPLEKPLYVATSFLEHSTRTKFSFSSAITRLGGYHIDFQAENSSLKKGESLEQTLLTLKYQGIDVCVIRTKVSHLLDQFKERPPIKIINGGDGSNQHPTQALLDLMTFIEVLGDVKGKRITIIGDCVHSRVTHSLMQLLPMYGVDLYLCGPEEFIPQHRDERIKVAPSLDSAIENSDALYLLRIQSERHESSDKKSKDDPIDYHEQWGLNISKLKKHKKNIPLFHPGPANIGVEVSDQLINSSLWMAHHQVKNSVYMRMAIIEAMVGNMDHEIGAKYTDISKEILGE